MNGFVDISSDFLADFEEELQQFYFDVIRDEKDVRKVWHVMGIRRALKEVSQYQPHIHYDNPSKRCAYMMKYGPLLTSAVAKYFLQVIQTNSYLFQKAISRGRLAICCLGGGPASDAVAIIRVIRALYRPHWQRTKKSLKVNVTVVGISEDWRVTAKNALQCLEDTPRFFGVNEIDLSYGFYQADLTDEMSEDIRINIKKADIVSMIYFLSTVNHSKEKDKSIPIMEKIMLTMKKDSVLFFMNSAADIHYKLQNAATEKSKTMTKIFGPLVDEFQYLSIDSVKECLDLYSEHFYRYVCMTDGFVSVSSWYKPESVEIKHINTIVSDEPQSRKKSFDSVELMAKIKAYRGMVQGLVEFKFETSIWQSRFHLRNVDDVLLKTEKNSNPQQSTTKSKISTNLKNIAYCLPEHLPQIEHSSKVMESKAKQKSKSYFYNRSQLKNGSQNCFSDGKMEKVKNVIENIPTASEVVFCIEKVILWMEKQSESNDIHLSHLFDMKQYANKKRFCF